MELTPAQRSLIARIAASERVARPGYDGRKATEAARSAQWAKYIEQVDPEGVLSEAERERRAKHLWTADMCRAKLRASRARSRRSSK